MVVFQQSENQHKFPLFYQPENMFWLHCNGCYCQPEAGIELRFYITNCSHIYCEKCVTECTKERCRVCRSQCTTLELSGKLQKEVENLFDEPMTIVQRAIKQANQTSEFQKSHQRRWCRRLKETVKLQSQQVKDVKKLVHQYQTLEKECMDLRKENNYLKCLIAKSDPGIRGGQRNGSFSGGSSPSQPLFRRSPHHPSMQMNEHRMGSSTNVLHQPGRILMRTPPSGGKLGTTRGPLSYLTPGSSGSSIESMTRTATTPLTVPRPICLSQND